MSTHLVKPIDEHILFNYLTVLYRLHCVLSPSIIISKGAKARNSSQTNFFNNFKCRKKCRVCFTLSQNKGAVILLFFKEKLIFLLPDFFCRARKVNGGWSGWSPWSGCAAGICSGNQRIRTRTCTNPLPSDDGAYCDGENAEQKDCMSKC